MTQKNTYDITQQNDGAPQSVLNITLRYAACSHKRHFNPVNYCGAKVGTGLDAELSDSILLFLTPFLMAYFVLSEGVGEFSNLGRGMIPD